MCGGQEAGTANSIGVATAATGGLAAVVIAGSVAAGGFAGGQMVSGITTIFNLPDPTSGAIATGSPNVLTNARPAVRAMLDSAGGCSGMPMNHPPLPVPVPVQEGSKTVLINGQPASRLKSKLLCGAHIKTGSPNVIIGGETARVGFVFDLEAWTKTGLQVLGIGAMIGGGLFAVAAGLAATGLFVGIGGLGYLAFEGIGLLGDALGPGYRDLLQGIAGMGLLLAGPKIAKGTRRPTPASAADDVKPPPFTPKKPDQLEPGAVPSTLKLEADMRAAAGRTGRSAPGYPDLPDDVAKTFGEGVRPWNGDEHVGPIRRVIGEDSNPRGSFWQSEVPPTEADWRAGSAVKNGWNGDGTYVEADPKGLKGWIGPAAPQEATGPGMVLPGGGEQIWIPPNTATPSSPIATPWNPRK